MKTNYKESLASEEIKECVGDYNFTVLVEEDKEMLSLFRNPFIIALKATIKQGGNVLGIGRANSILSPRNKFIKAAVLYTWNSALVDGISKTVKILNTLPLKANEQPIAAEDDIEEPDLEGRDRTAFYGNEEMPQYATDKQKTFLTKLVSSKCDIPTKEDYLNRLKSPYLTKFDCSELINSLLTK